MKKIIKQKLALNKNRAKNTCHYRTKYTDNHNIFKEIIANQTKILFWLLGIIELFSIGKHWVFSNKLTATILKVTLAPITATHIHTWGSGRRGGGEDISLL
jgi:hypothetical protein